MDKYDKSRQKENKMFPYSRSDPMTVSRGNSTERELSEEPLLRSRQDSGHHEFRSSQERSVPASRDGAGSPDFRSEVSTGKFSNFYRYKSMRDHTGRFFLLVKIR